MNFKNKIKACSSDNDQFFTLLFKWFDEENFWIKNAPEILKAIQELEKENWFSEETSYELISFKIQLRNPKEQNEQHELDFYNNFINRYPHNKKAILEYLKKCLDYELYPDLMTPKIIAANENEFEFLALFYLYLAQFVFAMMTKTDASSNRIPLLNDYITLALKFHVETTVGILKQTMHEPNQYKWTWEGILDLEIYPSLKAMLMEKCV